MIAGLARGPPQADRTAGKDQKTPKNSQQQRERWSHSISSSSDFGGMLNLRPKASRLFFFSDFDNIFFGRTAITPTRGCVLERSVIQLSLSTGGPFRAAFLISAHVLIRYQSQIKMWPADIKSRTNPGLACVTFGIGINIRYALKYLIFILRMIK